MVCRRVRTASCVVLRITFSPGDHQFRTELQQGVELALMSLTHYGYERRVAYIMTCVHWNAYTSTVGYKPPSKVDDK